MLGQLWRAIKSCTQATAVVEPMPVAVIPNPPITQERTIKRFHAYEGGEETKVKYPAEYAHRQPQAYEEREEFGVFYPPGYSVPETIASANPSHVRAPAQAEVSVYAHPSVVIAPVQADVVGESSGVFYPYIAYLERSVTPSYSEEQVGMHYVSEAISFDNEVAADKDHKRYTPFVTEDSKALGDIIKQKFPEIKLEKPAVHETMLFFAYTRSSGRSTTVSTERGSNPSC